MRSVFPIFAVLVLASFPAKGEEMLAGATWVCDAAFMTCVEMLGCSKLTTEEAESFRTVVEGQTKRFNQYAEQVFDGKAPHTIKDAMKSHDQLAQHMEVMDQRYPSLSEVMGDYVEHQAEALAIFALLEKVRDVGLLAQKALSNKWARGWNPQNQAEQVEPVFRFIDAYIAAVQELDLDVTGRQFTISVGDSELFRTTEETQWRLDSELMLGWDTIQAKLVERPVAGEIKVLTEELPEESP